MLIKHIKANNKIYIQVDSDCDGYTSAAVLINYLNCLFPSFVQNNITYKLHEKKIHGIAENQIPEGTKLVIAPDSSSNDYEIHQRLKEKGIDVLIIDHHEADKVSEYACVINNQLCDYPTKSLSGVGMVYKFCSHIDKLLGTNYADNYLDLTAVGIIADVMELKDFETREIVDLGLSNIKNELIKHMIHKNGRLDYPMTPFKVAFYIAPIINAVTRVGTLEEKFLLFEAMLDFRALEILPSTKRGCKGQTETRIEQATRTSTNVKNRQGRSRDAGFAMIEEIIEEKQLLDNKVLVIKLDKKHSIDKGLTGLIANQLMGKYQRPVLVLNQYTDEDNNITWEGSGRGCADSEFSNFRGFLEDSQIGLYAQGHANAFGFGVTDENFSKLVEYINSELADYSFTPQYKVDFIYSGYNIPNGEIEDIAKWNRLWGQGVSEPLVVIERVSFGQVDIKYSSKTIRINVPGSEVTLVKFNSSEEEYNSLIAPTDSGGTIIDVVGTCSINDWNGKPQILVEDFEVKEFLDYYF